MNAPLASVFSGLAAPSAGATPRRVDFLETAVASVTVPARPKIPFTWADEFKYLGDELRQVVEGVITEAGMSVWFGESNSGKTYLVLHLCYCVSRGVPFFGKRVEGGAVIYIAAEGASSIRRRVIAFEKHHGEPFGHFGLIPTTLNLMDPSADVEDLIELVTEKAAEIGRPVRLVVVDTVARAMGGANENASEDMARWVSACDQIRERTGAHVLGIHHSGKDAAKGARGHSSLRAAVDTEIEVTADELTKTHTARITKQRDLPTKGERLSGRFVPVDVGHDQWGGVMTACAVEPADPPPAGVKVMAPAQQAVMAYLAGRAAGVRKAAIAAALEPQGVSRASVYRAINGPLQLGLLTDTLGLIYLPKE